MNHRALSGHLGSVLAVAFSPDGKTLASISYDKTLRLWNVKSGDCICVFDTLVVPTQSCKLFFGTNTVALINSLNNVLLWNLRTRERVQLQLRGFFCGVFCHDNTLFASAGYEPTVRICNVETGLEQEILADHRDLFCSIAFSHSKTLLAAGSRDKTIWLWNFETEACEKRFVGHDGSVGHVAFSPDDKIMASSAGGTNMLIWSVNSGRCLYILPLNFHTVLRTTFHRSSKLVASVGDFDSRILVWNVETGVSTGIDGCVYGECGVAFQPNGKTLASGGYDSAIRLWRLLDYDALCGALQLFFIGVAPYVLLDVANMCGANVRRFDAASTFLRFEKICFIEGAIERCKKCFMRRIEKLTNGIF